MTDQPKVTPDQIEPEPAWRGRMRMTQGRKKAVAVLVTIVFCWAAYVGHTLAGVLLFPVFILWNWAVPSPQTDRGVWRPRRASDEDFDSYFPGSIACRLREVGEDSQRHHDDWSRETAEQMGEFSERMARDIEHTH